MSGIVGIKVPQDSPIVKCVSVIRKLEPSTAISEISSRVKNDQFIFSCDYVDDSGIKNIIKCYEELTRMGIVPRIYEHDRECDIQLIRNLNQTYDEIGEEIKAEIEDEFENDDLIFEYKLCDAWRFPIVSLRVFDRPEDNIQCILHLPSIIRWTKRLYIKSATLSTKIAMFSKLRKWSSHRYWMAFQTSSISGTRTEL